MTPNIFNHKSGKKLNAFQKIVVNVLHWICTKGLYWLILLSVFGIVYPILALLKALFIQHDMFIEYNIFFASIVVFILIKKNINKL